jgi:probable phosphoglycerate mutase
MAPFPDIYLVRHGETLWNLEKRFQGMRDSPLTETGRAQAAVVARILARELGDGHRAALQTSPLPRAVATAAIIHGVLAGPAPAPVPALRELHLGAWEGLRRAEIKAGWPALLTGVPKAEWYFAAPGGEGYDAALARVEAWLHGLAGPVVAVSHSVTGRLIRGLYAGLSRPATLALPAPQDGVWHLGRHGVVELTET